MGDCFSIDSRTRGIAMPKSYSCDLRQRVIGRVESGASRHEAAEHFGVAVSSVVKWMQRWNESRSAAPKARGGSTSPLERQARADVGFESKGCLTRPDWCFLTKLLSPPAWCGSEGVL